MMLTYCCYFDRDRNSLLYSLLCYTHIFIYCIVSENTGCEKISPGVYLTWSIRNKDTIAHFSNPLRLEYNVVY